MIENDQNAVSIALPFSEAAEATKEDLLPGQNWEAEIPKVIKSAIHFQDGKASHLVDQDWLLRFETAYRLEAETWGDVAAKGTATGASVWDGYAAMWVADAAIRSLTSGRAENVVYEPRPSLYNPIG